jgi:hypothetical protein
MAAAAAQTLLLIRPAGKFGIAHFARGAFLCASTGDS